MSELDFALEGHCCEAMTRLRWFVKDFEVPLPGGASRLKEPVQPVQTSDWFIEKPSQHQEATNTPISICRWRTRCARKPAMRSIHMRRESSSQDGRLPTTITMSRPSKRFACCIEPRMLALLAGVNLDLPNPAMLS